MINAVRIGKIVDSMEKCIYAFTGSSMNTLYPVVERCAKKINAIVEDKMPERREPESHPSREENKNRYKPEDIRQEDKDDYADTLFDPDMRNN